MPSRWRRIERRSGAMERTRRVALAGNEVRLIAAASQGHGALATVTEVLGASPPVLFFFLGMFATLARSTLAIPKAVTKLLSLYLLWSIGF